MGQIRDLTGMVFGRLTVMGRADEDYISPKGKRGVKWHCRCECGNEIDVLGKSLCTGNTKSCGCYNRECCAILGRRSEGLYVDDLTGLRFGRLVALFRVNDHVSIAGERVTKWHCRCDCGNEVDVIARSLKSGNTTSCGCYRKEQALNAVFQDLTGLTFGRLYVIDRADDVYMKSGRRNIMWNCRCDCGNLCVVSGKELRKGSTKSCGCYHKEIAAKTGKACVEDLTGQIFGRLQVLHRVDNYISPKGKSCVKWHCRCECGTELDVTAGSLKCGQKSCGCIKSGLEYLVIQYFNKKYIIDDNYSIHKTYDDLVGVGGGLLSYDFIFYKDDGSVYLIECQGQQHYHPVSLFGGDDQFETQQEHDRRKREYAEQLGVPLIEIPYTADTYEKVAAILQEHGI